MNNNLPQIKKEGIFTRISNWLKKLFGHIEIIESPVEENVEEKNINQRENFRDSIKVKNKDVILFLQKKLKENQISISDLTDEQLEEMIELYEAQVEEKRNILKNYKDKLLQKKKEVWSYGSTTKFTNNAT